MRRPSFQCCNSSRVIHLHQPKHGHRANDTHSVGAPLRLHLRTEPPWTSNIMTVPSAAPRAISCSLADTAIAPVVTPADHFTADVLACVSTNRMFPSASAAHAPPFASSHHPSHILVSDERDMRLEAQSMCPAQPERM